jgi:DNA-binding GntR family transcriptional regulator
MKTAGNGHVATYAAVDSLSRLAPPSSLRERVEKEIAAAIMSGQMAPGELFSAPTLAARFGVSATPVREAMLNLEKRGLIEVFRNKGFRVSAVSAEDTRAIVEVRQILEVAAVRRLTGTLDAADLADLRALADRIVETAGQGDLPSYLAADTAFHLTLLALAGNSRLTAIVADLRSQTRMVGLAGMVDTEQLRASAREHHELLDLLEGSDEGRVADLLHHHIGHALGWWSGLPEPLDPPLPPPAAS